jgi:16S rRNA (cytosine967-C5)-methyltransferase
VTPDSVRELAELQHRILAAGAAATRPGGVLLYSVCTISRVEGSVLIDRFVEQNPEFALEESRQLLPHRDGTDGFFIARLRRA